MANEKSDIAEAFNCFSIEELNMVVVYLGELESLRTREVEETLDIISAGFLPLTGFSAVNAFFDASGKLAIDSADKKQVVYETLKETPASILQTALSDIIESKRDAAVTKQKKSEDSRINQNALQSNLPGQLGFVSCGHKKADPASGYFQIDDEEYTVKSKFVHPSPTGIEEGYPPLKKKKKKLFSEY